MKQLQNKTCRIEHWEQKSGESGKQTMEIAFYACAFGNVDSWGDIIVSNACDDFLKSEAASRMRLCWQHDMKEVIGIIREMKADEKGLLVKAEILPTSRGLDAMTLIGSGALNEFSIGYYADKYHYEKMVGMTEDVRVLDAITIREASIVSMAANPKATLLSAKSDEGKELIHQASDSELEAMKKAIDEEQCARLLAGIQ